MTLQIGYGAILLSGDRGPAQEGSITDIAVMEVVDEAGV
jgi:hypothetical protein